MNIYHADDVPEDLKEFFRPVPQIGLEATPELYVEKLVAVFRECRRVLRNDGVLWLNMGDSYAASGMGGNPDESGFRKQATNYGSLIHGRRPPPWAKPKDLLGMPWMLAFALRADGWYLRCDVVWSKPNPMPESVIDRPTRSHEYVFLLTKSARYRYFADSIRTPQKDASIARDQRGRDVDVPTPDGQKPQGGRRMRAGATMAVPTGWDTEKRAHGTTMPTAVATSSAGTRGGMKASTIGGTR